MQASDRAIDHAAPPAPPTPHAAPAAGIPLLAAYIMEGLLSVAGSLLFIGIFFYTTKIFGWGIIPNFLLASAQGAVYIVASLTAQKLSKAMSNRGLLIASNLAMIVICSIAALTTSHALIVAMILVYVPLLGLNWPVLESLCADAPDAHQMSRQVGLYNLIWAGTGAAAVALQGTILSIDPRGVFIVPAAIHFIAAVTFFTARKKEARPEIAPDDISEAQVATAKAPAIQHAHDSHAPHILSYEPAPAELLRHRTLALWLSRIALPATYVVIYSVSALMPLLPVTKSLNPTLQTALGSVWMISRWIAFMILGATVFWHSRPRLLLGAAIVMGIAFVGVTVSPSVLAGEMKSTSLDLGLMIGSQVLLGLAMGTIYMASLYFGMVLSQGSTEHAGYHEALIGLGQVLGPGIGALTQWRWPGAPLAGVGAVGLVILASLIAAIVAAIRAERQ